MQVLNTHELRKGDVVLTHGMRCLIDLDIMESITHDDSRGRVLWTQALVLNRDDEATNAVPTSWTADWKRDGKLNGEHRWTIQGNQLAQWHVVERDMKLHVNDFGGARLVPVSF